MSLAASNRVQDVQGNQSSATIRFHVHYNPYTYDIYIPFLITLRIWSTQSKENSTLFRCVHMIHYQDC
ncbi:hypothetical protein L1987_61804 [Smallanthus sonchifolius]|uniref:Uncharacterized protein n=1 Tax=Smallanthus sonchifolius TaxID=185202 RepID=A0ACB9C8Y0_9ASTR|nr:hypothetical protein L1987_61804 [Smallanthus sonchifolius]